MPDQTTKNTWLIAVFRNTSSTVAVRGLFGAARVAAFLMIARSYAPDDFGRLSLALSVTELFKVIGDFGLDTVSIRRYAKHRLLSALLLSNALLLKLCASTLAYIGSLVFFRLVYAHDAGLSLLLIIATSIYTTLLLNAFLSYFQANLAVSRVIGSTAVSALLYVGLTSYLLINNASLALLAALIPLGELVNLVLTARIFRRDHVIRLRADMRIIGMLLRESLPAGITAVAAAFYLRLDQLMIGYYLGEQGVGEYAAAFRITEPFLLIFSALSVSLYAQFSASVSALPERRRPHPYVPLLLRITAASIAVALAVFLFSETIIRILPGAYRSSLAVMNVLCWAIVFKAITPQLSAIIGSYGKFRILTTIAVLVLVITALSNAYFIPRYGITGAAMTVVLAESANTAMQYYCISRLAAHGTPGSAT